MAKYKCSICGFIYDEEEKGVPFSSITECPVCHQPASVFVKLEEETASVENEGSAQEAISNEALDYPKELSRRCENERYMDTIHEMAVTGKPVVASMATTKPIPGWDDVLIMGCQLNPPPLDEDAPVSTTTVIGKNAKKPMTLESPVFISHMSFGALSKEAKTALAKGSAAAKTAMCSGEGGVLPEEKAAAYKYIFEYVPNKYSVTEDNLKNSDAIEIKIGQSAKPGMGGLLPAGKVTESISKIRGKEMGKDIVSPSKFPEINTKEDLKNLVDTLRDCSGGRPIGIKIAAGRVEKDLKFIVFAEPDFITIDGRGGATGAAPQIVRDSTSLPTLFALYRARKYLDDVGCKASLIMTGGFRVSSDIAKAIALGADAVALATAGLMALACQQYKICQSGNCPMGVATQKGELRGRLNVEVGAKRVAQFLNCTRDELQTFARITGHSDVHELCVDDLATTNSEISNYTNIEHI